MKLFVRNILGFALLFAISFLVIVVVNFILTNSSQLVPDGKRHILILGDSNTECAVNDSILHSGVNLSFQGDSYFYSFLKLKHVLSSNSNIDVVLLAFAPHNVVGNSWLLADHRIKSHFKLYYPFMRLKDFTFIFLKKPNAVVASVLKIVQHALENARYALIHGNIQSSKYGRFEKWTEDNLTKALEKLANGDPLPFFENPDDHSVSSVEIIYLDEIISLCDQYHVKLIFINTPKRQEILGYPKYGCDKFYQLYDSRYQHIDFLDFSNFKFPDDCYGDLVHLNYKGANHFSSFLMESDLSFLLNEFNRNKTRALLPENKRHIAIF